MKLICVFHVLTDRTLERFWQSVSDAAKCVNNGDNFGNDRNQEGIASFEDVNCVDENLSNSELQRICSQMNVASDMIVKTAPITPTQGEQRFLTTGKPIFLNLYTEWLLEFSLQGGMILANSVYEVEGRDIESGLAQITELLEAKIPIFRSTVLEVNNNDYRQVLLTKGSPRWIRTYNLDAYFETTFTEKMKLGGSPVQYALVQNDKTLEGKTFFIISIQHSFFDVFSRSIMERDILQILHSPAEYALEAERPWYGDFAKHMRARSDYDARLKQYWSSYLQGAEFANIHAQNLATPSDFQDGIIQWAKLDVPASASAQQTPLTLTAWTLALARQSGLRDIIFGLARHGRSYPFQNIRRTIGPFLSLTPIRLRLGDEQATRQPEVVGDLVQRMQDEILSTARWEQGAIPGVYPDDKGKPWVQTWVNVKSELYTMGNGYVDKNESGKISKFVPRTDLHPLWMKSHWAVCLLIYFKRDGVEACAGYRTSLIGHNKARNLFADFQQLVRKLADGQSSTVDSLLT